MKSNESFVNNSAGFVGNPGNIANYIHLWGYRMTQPHSNNSKDYDHTYFEQPEWYCQECRENHFGNCPRMGIVTSYSVPPVAEPPLTPSPNKSIEDKIDGVLGVHKANVEYLLELLYKLVPNKTVTNKEYEKEWHEVREQATHSINLLLQDEEISTLKWVLNQCTFDTPADLKYITDRLRALTSKEQKQ